MSDSGTSVTLVIPPSAVVPPTPGVPGIVVPPRGHLPLTGFDLSTALVLTALLLALGALLLLSGRRRPDPHLRRT